MTEFKRVFLDTAPIIYYLENSSYYMDAMGRFFERCIAENIQTVTSAVTVEEYLVYPYSSGKLAYVDNFKKFIEYMMMDVVSIDYRIAEKGAKIRGRYKNFKAMDALQIAAAVAGGCDMFFTNDKQLRQQKELPCMTMDDLPSILKTY